jgi:RNA polymerase sigma factor, sigma-70 family
MKQEHEEINKWIELYSESLLNRALSMVRDKEDAMDLVQEVFISATAAYRTFERKSTPLTWLLNILKNKIADFYRHKYRKPETVNMPEFFDHTGSWKDDSILHEWSQNFDEPDEQKALMNTLDKCLDHLPSQWQVTVKLYYLEEKKAKEVCQELDITTTNLWKILQRSRMQLRKCIELNWFDKL